MDIAFPNSEGFGDNIGGRGGDVYFVTNLNDSGAGSLRDAVGINDSNRIAMVMVNGTITNLTNLTVRSNKTILGQCSDGQGICLRDRRMTIIARNNIVMRYIRSRLGDVVGAESTNMFLRDCENIMVDHCTFSWGTDETVTSFRNRNVTIQWSMVSEPLHDSVHSKGPHGYSWFLGGKNISAIHNLVAHGDERNPYYDNLSVYTLEQAELWRGLVDYRNNVTYNWQENSIHGLTGISAMLNMINNYLKPGPATFSSVERRLLRITIDTVYNTGYGRAYANGNIIEGETDINSDNWLGIDLSPFQPDSVSKMDNAFEVGNIYNSITDAINAYNNVLAYSGASKLRDSVDTRIISEVTNGTFTFGNNGIIDSQTDVGGWPILTGGTVQDSFDQMTLWLDNNGFSDRPALTDWTDDTQRNNLAAYLAQIDVNTGYAIAEVYANSLVVNTFPSSNPTTYNLILSSSNETFGTVSRSLSNPVTAGATVQLTATPVGTGAFQGWYLGTVSFANLITTDNPYSRVVNSDAIIIASFVDGTPIPPEQPRKKWAKKRNEVV